MRKDIQSSFYYKYLHDSKKTYMMHENVIFFCILAKEITSLKTIHI